MHNSARRLQQPAVSGVSEWLRVGRSCRSPAPGSPRPAAGGFTSARRIATLAQTANLQVAPHVWESAVLFYASLQLAAAIPNCPIFEFRTGEFGPFSDLVDIAPSVDAEGYVHVPDRPGLGFELDLEEAQRKFPFE